VSLAGPALVSPYSAATASASQSRQRPPARRRGHGCPGMPVTWLKESIGIHCINDSIARFLCPTVADSNRLAHTRAYSNTIHEIGTGRRRLTTYVVHSWRCPSRKTSPMAATLKITWMLEMRRAIWASPSRLLRRGGAPADTSCRSSRLAAR
jgi:hypothetical protein